MVSSILSQKRTKLTTLNFFFTKDSEFGSFFGRIEKTIIWFRDCLTFNLSASSTPILLRLTLRISTKIQTAHQNSTPEQFNTQLRGVGRLSQAIAVSLLDWSNLILTRPHLTSCCFLKFLHENCCVFMQKKS